MRLCEKCALRCACSARCLGAKRKQPSHFQADASSAIDRSICISKVSRRWARRIAIEQGNVKVFAGSLIGAVVNLRGKLGPTVLGTDNVMMAAVLAEGTTVIESAAAEPEVVDLANFLNKMGAKIEGAGTRRIIIEGVKELARSGTRGDSGSHRSGHISRRWCHCRERSDSASGSNPVHLDAVTDALSRTRLWHRPPTADTVTVRGNGAPKPLRTHDRTVSRISDRHAGADVRASAQDEGISVITETIFPQRFMHVSELKRMGADIELEGPTAIIKGVERTERRTGDGE